MGILCDLFVGNSKEALNYTSFQAWDARGGVYSSVQLRGLTEVEFGKLLTLLEHDGTGSTDGLQEVQRTDDSWLFRFSDEHVAMIAALGSDSVAAIVAQWSDSAGEVLDEKSARSIVSCLIQLAQQARKERKSLYLWVSL